LSKEGGFLQNAQLIGAKQRSDLFLIRYVCFFFLKQDYYKIEVEIDSVTKKVTILSELAKINIETGFAV